MKKSAGERASYASLNGLARVPLDDALEALRHIQRRKLLFGLLDREPLVDHPTTPPDSEDETDTLDRLVAMKHVHLPKLVEYGFIDWNRDTLDVTKGPKFGEIVPLLELLADHEDELPEGWL